VSRTLKAPAGIRFHAFLLFPQHSIDWQGTCTLSEGGVCHLEITLQHAGGTRFSAQARHHRIILDQPREDGATDQGMSPAELLLISLGGCVGQHVMQYLNLRGLPSEGLAIRVEASASARPLHFGDFTISVTVPSLDDRQLRELEKSSPAGLVHNAIRFANLIKVTAGSSRPGISGKK
jgi:putative redox protein